MLHGRCRFQDFYGWIVLRIIIIYYVPAKLCNQRNIFSHDVELNNKGILHFTFFFTCQPLSRRLHFSHDLVLSFFLPTATCALQLCAISSPPAFNSCLTIQLQFHLMMKIINSNSVIVLMFFNFDSQTQLMFYVINVFLDK